MEKEKIQNVKQNNSTKDKGKLEFEKVKGIDEKQIKVDKDKGNNERPKKVEKVKLENVKTDLVAEKVDGEKEREQRADFNKRDINRQDDKKKSVEKSEIKNGIKQEEIDEKSVKKKKDKKKAKDVLKKIFSFTGKNQLEYEANLNKVNAEKTNMANTSNVQAEEIKTSEGLKNEQKSEINYTIGSDGDKQKVEMGMDIPVKSLDDILKDAEKDAKTHNDNLPKMTETEKKAWKEERDEEEEEWEEHISRCKCG